MSSHHQLRRSLAIGVAVLGLATPAASARPVDLPLPNQPAVVHPDVTGGYSAAPSPEAAPTVRSTDDGLDWASVALGAGAAAAIAAAVYLANLVVVRRGRAHLAR